ncbi:related to glutathione s-transferase 3 [Melanopsichium pennsylvanicum]|uniref:Related to glutathione s-transferase 3 n=2 Tax=Melanopsichium pennsylvanicum TaxID=63383 RepID=A0AAJ4XRK4_9BASI|nr:related to glutathione s-transferase 3 [Melanopsichium pennsylvanicum 4]SNX86616.1 related to glutathione s-transferase 3 [Melanopsichium pennsylvanicum]
MSKSVALPALAASFPAFYHFLAPKPTTVQGFYLPVGYGYVVSCVVSSIWVTFFMGVKVGSARKAAQVPYPYLYAEKAIAEKNHDAHLFNCAQRVHQNTLEFLTSFVFLTLFNGLFFPKLTAAISATWVLSRIPYAIGYYSGTPSNRAFGAILSGLSFLGLLVLATYTCFTIFGASPDVSFGI